MAVSKREKGTEMTNYSKNNKKHYDKVVAREAYEMVSECKSCEFIATETLEAAMQEADERVFYAEMSDDYKVRNAERYEIAEHMKVAVEELNRRRAA